MTQKESPPLEIKTVEIRQNDVWKNVPALHKNWVVRDRVFSQYIPHPVLQNGQFHLGERETWLEVMKFIHEDLKWLLGLPYHKFWSHMIFACNVRKLLSSFLQEAPPYYLRHKFPDDEEMVEALEECERLVFLVFWRISKTKESSHNYVANLGELLYDNYLFTVPILFDICLIYGVRYEKLTVHLVQNVLAAEPRYLDDFQETIAHILQKFEVIRSKFNINDQETPVRLADRRDLDQTEMADLVMHFYDTFANVQIFINIYPRGCRIFAKADFLAEIASFYANVLPQINFDVLRKDCDYFQEWNIFECVQHCRVEILTIFRHVFSYLINEAVENEDKKQEFVDQYLSIVSEVLSEQVFVSDYDKLYPIDEDIEMLRQIHPGLDTVKVNYIQEGLAACANLPPLHPDVTPEKKLDHHVNYPPVDDEEAARAVTRVGGVQLESLITEVKDILPHLGEGFIQKCLEHFNYKTDKVIAAVLEDNLPSRLSEIDWNLNRMPKDAEEFDPDEFEEINNVPPRSAGSRKTKNKIPYKDMKELMDDKSELKELRDRYSRLSIVEDDAYNDEYDDTYESFDVPVREAEAEKERRPFVVPRVLRVNEESEESEEEDEVVPVQNQQNRDCFVQNPAEIRERYEQRRAERATKRDVVGKPKGKGQDKEVVHNRDFKGTHKSVAANHNRRKQASRKRNQGMIPS